MYEVHVLQEGYSRLDEDGTMLANGTSTLIKGGQHIIVVDTLSPWDADVLKTSLAQYNVKCEDVTHLVCTHGHPDHVGNNNLFTSAVQHIVGFSVHHKDAYFIHPFECAEELVIDEDVVVVPTPGHTLDSVSVRVRTEGGVVFVVGDLFEKAEDVEDESVWRDAGSDDPVAQKKNRRMVLQQADFIVPGHGGMFRVTDDMKRTVAEEEI